MKTTAKTLFIIAWFYALLFLGIGAAFVQPIEDRAALILEDTQ